MQTVVLAILIFALALAGGLAPLAMASSFDEQRMRIMTSVGGGFLLGSALLIVVPEGFHLAEESGVEVSAVALGTSLLTGFLVMLLLEGFGLGHSVHEEHHDHSELANHGHVHHPEHSVTLPFGLTVHAAADGLAIGAAATSADQGAAVLVAVAVLFHKVPAAFSLGTFALHERPNRKRAALDVLGFALVTPIALAVAGQVLEAETSWLALLLLFSAGTFLYVATVDTLPAIHAAGVGRRTAIEVLAGAGLFAVILVVLNATGLITELH